MEHRYSRPGTDGGDEPPKDALASLANILTGGDRRLGQELPPEPAVLQQLRPYSRWLYKHLKGIPRPTSLDTIGWFRKVVHYFSDHEDGQIRNFLAVEKGNFPNGREEEFMQKLILQCLSYWLTVDLLHRALDNAPETRHITKNCVADLQSRTERDILAGAITPRELTYNGRLVLHEGAYSDPMKSIPALALNAHKLMKFGRLKVKWTSDVSQHLVLDEEESHLMLFCFPGLLSVHDGFSDKPAVKAFRRNITKEFTEEIFRSYWLLFGSKRTGRKAFKRALHGDPDNKPDDKVLSDQSIQTNNMDTVWARDKFAYLWPRILELKSHLDGSEPEEWWELLWRDKNQPYVYVPGFISIVILLLALISTGATVAQTIKLFQS